MKPRKLVATALALSMTMSLVTMPAYAAPPDGNAMTRTGTFLTTCVNQETRQTRMENVSSQLTIACDGPTAPGIQTTVRAGITLPTDCTVDTIRWYVNGECVQTISTTSVGRADTTFKLTYDKPTVVYCTFSGFRYLDSADTAALGDFQELSTACLSLGRDSGIGEVGGQWAWEAGDNTSGTWIPPVSGVYRIKLVAADGGWMTDTVNLRKDTGITPGFPADGSVSFGTASYAPSLRALGNETVPGVYLELKSLLVDILSQPTDAGVNDGEQFSFHCEADGNGLPVTYQWYRNTFDQDGGTISVKLDGATEASYHGVAAPELNRAEYWCQVSNSQNTAVTEPATLLVYGAPAEAPVIRLKDAQNQPVDPDTWVKGSLYYQVSANMEATAEGEMAIRMNWDNSEWEEVTLDKWTKFSPEEKETVSTLYVESYNQQAPEQSSGAEAVLKLDNAAPEFEVSGNPEEWTKEPVTLTIRAEDAASGLAELPYSWDNGRTWTGDAAKTMESNGTVWVKVKDAVGNISAAQKVIVNRMDTQAPTIYAYGNPGWWQKSVELTVSASDYQSGLADLPYSWDNGKTWTAENTLKVEENQVVKLRVKDAAGNEAIREIDVNRIDNTAPTAELVGIPTEWTNEPAFIQLENVVEEGSGLTQYPYSFDNGLYWYTTDYRYAYHENGTYNIIVRDNAGNRTILPLEIKYIDKQRPEDFTITGVPTEWTQGPVILKAENLSDAISGLPADAYRWNNMDWGTSTVYLVDGNGPVTLSVRDRAGNTRTKTVQVRYIDCTGPEIVSVTGNPETAQSTAATVVVTARDKQSGLAPMAYSFDGGRTWSDSNKASFDRAQTITIKVRDAIGNETTTTYTVSGIDTTPPELNIECSALPGDSEHMLMKVTGTDDTSSRVEYSFDYNPQNPEAASWTTANQRIVTVGIGLNIGCRDSLGNVAYRYYVPGTVVNQPVVSGGTGAAVEPLGVSAINGYTFGPMDAYGQGTYQDATGRLHVYEPCMVNGATVYGIPVRVSAAASSGGVLKGKATFNGSEYPIYWDALGMSTMGRGELEGCFVLDASTFSSNLRGEAVYVEVTEYTDETCTEVIRTDTSNASVNVDLTAPVVNMTFNKTDKTVTVIARDVMSGLRSLKYRVNNEAGTGEWHDYTAPIQMTATGTITVLATDKLGNESTTESKKIIIEQTTTQAPADDGIHSSGDIFDRHFYGTGETNNSDKNTDEKKKNNGGGKREF